MFWTTEVPTKAGSYWWRVAGSQRETQVVEVYLDEMNGRLYFEDREDYRHCVGALELSEWSNEPLLEPITITFGPIRPVDEEMLATMGPELRHLAAQSEAINAAQEMLTCMVGTDIDAVSDEARDAMWTLAQAFMLEHPLGKDRHADFWAKGFEQIVEQREVFRRAIERIDQKLRVPAAEYIPAIGEVFTIIDSLKEPAHGRDEWKPDNETQDQRQAPEQGSH